METSCCVFKMESTGCWKMLSIEMPSIFSPALSQVKTEFAFVHDSTIRIMATEMSLQIFFPIRYVRTMGTLCSFAFSDRMLC